MVRLPPTGPSAAAQPGYSHGVNAGAHPNVRSQDPRFVQPQQPPSGRGFGSNPSHPPPPQSVHPFATGGNNGSPSTYQRGHHQGFSSRGRGRPFQRPQQGPHQPHQQYQQFDPEAFGRGGRQVYGAPPQPQRRSLYQPHPYSGPPPRGMMQAQQRLVQGQYLDSIAAKEIPIVEMNQNERDEKETLRKELERVCQEVCAADPERLPKVSIEGFGSFESGFASAGSDMDLVLVVEGSDPNAACFSPMEYDLPRSLEKRLLQIGYGARLLTRTRVPIIKVCQAPDSTLLSKLRQERERWDEMDHDNKYPHLKKEEEQHDEHHLPPALDHAEGDQNTSRSIKAMEPIGSTDEPTAIKTEVKPSTTQVAAAIETTVTNDADNKASNGTTNEGEAAQKPRREGWTRERKAGPLDFPKDGVGIQTDINFFNPLGIHNTQMLRCYSLCDPRVRPMILFVKSWVKRRKINSSYSGTLSSYGFVLMTLHYLMNIANPPVLPNLQQAWRPHDRCTPQSVDRAEVEGWEVDFWRRESEIMEAARHGVLTRNQESLGALLAGFFQYYSSQGGQPSFHWMGQVLSLRSPGGLLTKEEKGWVKAITEQGEGKQVQHRYLFCVEDPFEHSHNVARTVTHNGIVAIRDEFRRAHRILRAVGNGFTPVDGELFDQLIEADPQDPNTPGQHPDTMQPPGQNFNQHGRVQQIRPAQAAAQQKSLNVKDTEDFPSLGAPTAKQSARAARPGHKKEQAPQTGEISGERAKAYLEELKHKEAEDSAQATAAGAAAHVLGSMD